MNIACFVIGVLFGIAICGAFAIKKISDTYDKGYENGQKDSVDK